MDNDTLIAKAKEYISLEQDAFFRGQVEELLEKNDTVELNDRFYTDLAFGTGGLRGVIGGGYNRMNPYTVRRATQGLANYIKKAAAANSASVVIAYDSRNFSDLFALEAARVLSGNGIKTFLFTSLRPTPELSFAVRKLGATAGIVVTASHNPSEYNGYKVCWEDGAQVVEPHDTGIISEVRAVSGPINEISKEDAISQGKLVMIDKEVDIPFIEMVKAQAIRPELIRSKGKELKVVFTPLHGTGTVPVQTALSEMGIEVITVEEQKEPDGNFPTVKYPNPEEASAMRLALELAERTGADLVMGTDPDSDRLGIAAPEKGQLRLITGNQLGVLLTDYIFSSKKALGILPQKPAFISTIVTTELQKLIAQNFGALCFTTLTGFKYIGEKIREFESQKDGPQYVFGGEESYGYLVNTEVRDKDAVSAATLTAEMTLYHRTQGKSLFDRLREIWFEYGYFQETLISKTFKGESGLIKMKEFMDKLRTTPPKTFAGRSVEQMKDYRDGTTLNIVSGTTQKDIDLPSSNVLQFTLDDLSIISVRPSGTEPKIKFYASCRTEPKRELNSAIPEVEKKIEAISDELNGMID
ncbi:phospho-sugar mutase [Chitinispirillales bacterium ANBcel5]|uniref:phospho-sugar mutase n=1 Tax=Cellulosispirillum alkaliphilum TaxID=3039283 RepID=UPI002A52157E|nr:phospho-sugar mutase [Chitinispirillales bacterium ANBcel5]